MTNTKFRKRALLSSVAMLLVALVALGSATFAWFTNNPVAKADGIVAKGETSTGLVIYTDTDPTPTNTHAAKFMKPGTTTGDLVLLPAWLKDSSTLLTTTAKDSGSYVHDADDTDVKWGSITLTDASSYVAADGATPETKVALSGNAYKETAYLNTTGLGTGTKTDVFLTSLKINTTQAADRDIKAGLCVAVYVGTDRKGIFKVGTDKIKNYATTPAYGSTVGAESGTIDVLVNDSGITAALGQAGDAAADKLAVSFIVYLDGTDATVKTDNARAAELITGIEANFSTVNPNA